MFKIDCLTNITGIRRDGDCIPDFYGVCGPDCTPSDPDMCTPDNPDCAPADF